MDRVLLPAGRGGIADIRDAVQAIPGPGDGIKITGAIVCYIGKFPWKVQELGKLLSKEILPLLPDTLKLDVWRVVLSTRENAIITKLTNEGYSASQIQEMVVSSQGLTKSFLMKNVGEFNACLGNLHPYGAGVKKTVIGTYASFSGSRPYTEVGGELGANYLNFVSTPDWSTNEKFLDMMIDNGDEIILSVHPNVVPPGSGTTLKHEIDYLTSNGYSVSDAPHSDGLYRMVKI